MAAGSEVFARTVVALQPYAGEVVFVGGWVHALYLAEANSTDPPVRTYDIDVTIPARLLTGDRRPLLDLLAGAGFEIDEIGQSSGIVAISQHAAGGGVVDLDLLTEAPDPRRSIPIEGQPGLVVEGYPGQHILLENARWMEVGPEVHSSFDPPVRIRVPTLSAYASPDTHATSDTFAGDRTLMPVIVDQLIAGSHALGTAEDVARTVRTRLLRVLGETPGAAA